MMNKKLSVKVMIMKQKDEKCRVDYNGRCQISMTFLLLYVFTKMQEDINNSGSLNYS